MRSKNIPADAEIIHTYDALREFRDAFFEAQLYFLLIIGRHGLSKSSVRGAMSSVHRPRRQRNQRRPLHQGQYHACRRLPLVLLAPQQVVDLRRLKRLWAESNGRFLLRNLTENKPIKTVSCADNKSLGVPKQFETSSRVCLIMNRFAFGDTAEYDAIADRADMVYFDPTPAEVHANAAVWFWDQEIFDFIGRHLNLFGADKLWRTYVKAYERRQKGDWQGFWRGAVSARLPSNRSLRWRTIPASAPWR